MKISKRQLKKIIKEEYNALKRQGLITEYGPEDDFDHLRNSGARTDNAIPGSIARIDWIKFHHDPYYDTNPPEWLGNPMLELDAFLDLIISAELKNVLGGIGMQELYRPAMSEIDYEGIFHDGKTIMKILHNVFPNTNKETLRDALEKWAAEHTSSGKVHSGEIRYTQ